MRKKFIEELDNLNNELVLMGSKCEEAINLAVEEISHAQYEEEVYEKVASLEDEIDTKEKDIETLCLKLIYSEQPVACDLRFISSILKMISDLERIGDQARDIAELIKDFSKLDVINDTNIIKMANIVARMVKESVESFVRRDVELASKVINDDNEVDDIFLSIKNEVIMMISKDSDEAESIVDILMIAKYLERIADHSVNIAEWVTFAIKG